MDKWNDKWARENEQKKKERENWQKKEERRGVDKEKVQTPRNMKLECLHSNLNLMIF